MLPWCTITALERLVKIAKTHCQYMYSCPTRRGQGMQVQGMQGQGIKVQGMQVQGMPGEGMQGQGMQGQGVYDMQRAALTEVVTAIMQS